MREETRGEGSVEDGDGYALFNAQARSSSSGEGWNFLVTVHFLPVFHKVSRGLGLGVSK
jgi:hypothetical protein